MCRNKISTSCELNAAAWENFYDAELGFFELPWNL